MNENEAQVSLYSYLKCQQIQGVSFEPTSTFDDHSAAKPNQWSRHERLPAYEARPIKVKLI